MAPLGKADGSGCDVTAPSGAVRLGREPVAMPSTLAAGADANGLVNGLSPKRDESPLQAAEALANSTAAMTFDNLLLSQAKTRVRMTQHPKTQH